MKTDIQKYNFLIISVCLAAGIIAVYWPVYRHNFITYDDDIYVTNNSAVKAGLNLKTVKWAFTTDRAGNWHPLTWLSHTLDYQIFGNWAGGHHLVNVFYHIANTLLLFYFLKITTRTLWASAFIAAAFALHPLNVESVAWVAERKNVLSTLFWFLTMIAYVKYTNNKKWYFAALIFFILGLMAKPMLVTLPFVLLLLDYWPLERKFNKQLLTEKIPFFVCSAASCIVTYICQQKGGTITQAEFYGLHIRAANIIISYADYILKMIWPGKLIVLYPFAPSSFTAIKILSSAAIILVITLAVIFFRRHKFLTFGWLWYLGTLVPVIGFVQIGAHSMADRYTYVPLIGIFLMIAFGAVELLRERKILFAILAAIIFCWSAVASHQIKYWQDSLTLYRHTLDYPWGNFIIMSNYAASLNEAGRYEDALKYGRKVLKAKPDSPENHNTVGNILCNMGRIDEAIEEYKLAIQYRPRFPEAYFNLGLAVKKFNNLPQAVRLFEQAIECRPQYVAAYLEIVIALMEMEKFSEAADVCVKALRIEPDNVFLHGHLGMALSGAGKTDEAIEEIKYVLAARPGDWQMHRNLGILLSKKSLHAEAIEAYKKSLQIEPNDTNVKWLLEKEMKELNERQK